MKRWVLVTWGFAAAVALLNLSALWPLIVTPLAPLSFLRWWDFLAVPLAIGAVAALALLSVRRSAIAVNLAFWIAFVVSAEIWRTISLTDPALAADALCAEQNSFIRSLTFAAEDFQTDVHAAYVMPDRVMLWSYAERAFREVGPGIVRNLDFTKCREAVLALQEKSA